MRVRFTASASLPLRGSQARAEINKLQKDKMHLIQHNRQLLMELSRQQTAGGGGHVIAPERAQHEAASAAGALSDVVPSPGQVAELATLRHHFEELKTEFRQQSKELRAAVERNGQLEERAKAVEEREREIEGLRAQLTPLITTLKKDAAEERMWDDAAELRKTVDLAFRAGMPEYKVAHLITRAKEIEAKESPPRRMRVPPQYAVAYSVDGMGGAVPGGPDPSHQLLHNGATFLAGPSSSPYAAPAYGAQARRTAGQDSIPGPGIIPKRAHATKSPASRAPRRANSPARLRSEVASTRYEAKAKERRTAATAARETAARQAAARSETGRHVSASTSAPDELANLTLTLGSPRGESDEWRVLLGV
jgi:hypothetical protein